MGLWGRFKRGSAPVGAADHRTVAGSVIDLEGCIRSEVERATYINVDC
jgi:hypothetical protein